MSAGMKGLEERLRAVESSSEKAGRDCTNWYRNPDGPEAADRIATLEAEVVRLRGALTVADRTGWAVESEMTDNDQPDQIVMGDGSVVTGEVATLVWEICDGIREVGRVARAALAAGEGLAPELPE